MHYILQKKFCLVSLCLVLSCVDDPSKTSIISSVEPEAPRLGELINISGQGFGTEGVVSISGRPLNMVTWSEGFIQAQLPEDSITGVRYLVLALSDGRYSDPYPIFVDDQSINMASTTRFDFDPSLDDGQSSDTVELDDSIDQFVD